MPQSNLVAEGTGNYLAETEHECSNSGNSV